MSFFKYNNQLLTYGGKFLTISSNIITDGLVLYLDAGNTNSYPGTGTIWYDISGNGLNGTISGTTFDTNPKSMVFNGNEYINLGNPALLNPGNNNFSVSLWVYIIQNGGNYGVFTKSYAQAYGIYYTGGTNNIGLYIQSGAANNSISLVGNYSKWINIVWTIDSTLDIQKSYLNGAFNVQTNNVVGNLTTTSPLNIGRYSPENNQYFTGKVSIANVYNRILSPDEILYNYNIFKNRYL